MLILLYISAMWKICSSLTIILSSSLLSGCAPKKTETEPFFTINEDYISNFKFGMVCPDPEGEKVGPQTRGIGTGEICGNLGNIQITGEQTCIFNRRAIPCTWFGYSFDYDGIDNQAISCAYHDSEPGNDGNPDEIKYENSKSGEYTHKLEKISGHFYNPMYSGFNPYLKVDRIVKSEIQCSVDSIRVFTINYSTTHKAN